MPALKVSESTVIGAPVEHVYGAVRDLRRWPEWSPWLICEPGVGLSFAEDGDSYSWSGDITGAGSLAVKSEEPNRRIGMCLNFLKPFKSHADVAFGFSENEGGTEVTWTMDSSLPFFLFMLKGMMNAMIGSDYRRGLAMMKDLLEKGHVPSKLEYGEADVAPFTLIGVRTSCPIFEVGPSMVRDLTKAKAFLDGKGIEAAGQPLSIYHKWDFVKQHADYTIGIPVGSGPAELADGIVRVEVPANRSFTVIHTGPYRHLGNAWSAGMMREQHKKFKADKSIAPFEIYVSDPENTPEEALVTVVHIPMR